MLFMFLLIYSCLTFKPLQGIHLWSGISHVIVIAQWCSPSYSSSSQSCHYILFSHHSLIFSPDCKMTKHARCHLDSSLQGRVMAAFLKLGNWPPHESVERYLLCFHCSIRLCMNFFHLLAHWAKSSLNVFIMAMESVLPRGHPWCSTGCLGKTGIRKLPQWQATASNCAKWLQSPL